MKSKCAGKLLIVNDVKLNRIMNELLEKCHELLSEYKSILEQDGELTEAEQIYETICDIESSLER